MTRVLPSQAPPAGLKAWLTSTFRLTARVVCVLVLTVCGACTSVSAEPTNVFEQSLPPKPQNRIDELVFARFAKAGVQPRLCSDAVFLRRVHLDLLGTLPTATEARLFLEDTSPDKRSALVSRLLQRPEFSDYWAMKWGDALRIKAEFPVNLWPNAAQAYHRFVKASIAQNKPYDQFARELLTSSGSNFRVGAVNFYRAIQNRTPEGIAAAVALTLMGSRIDSWPSNRASSMTVFFSQVGYKPTSEWKEEHVFWDPLGASKLPGNNAPGRASVAAIGHPTNAPAGSSIPKATEAKPATVTFPDGSTAILDSDRDPREVFADWLIRPENPWFTRNIANRLWAWLMGRGIIHEPDDIRDDNPPADAAVLEFLQGELVASNYDLKQLYRLIACSSTYQLSPLVTLPPGNTNLQFAVYQLRRLDAEVLSDAINKVTGSSDLYTSPIPEPFTYIPRGMPAVSIADGSITSPFLALFGRSARATGMDNERNNKPTSAQALYLLNSSDLQVKLEQGTNITQLLNSGRRNPRNIAEEIYLTILSRLPTPEELDLLEDYRAPTTTKAASPKPAATTDSGTNTVATATNPPAKKGRPLGSLGPASKRAAQFAAQKRREDWVDVAWSLINTDEFLYRH